MSYRAALTCLLLVSACGGGSETAAPEAQAKAEAIGSAECAACGMVVREQPAPRGQVVHKDGTRAHLCSISDLARYLAEPSPHGKPRAVFVEVLDPAQDPKQKATGEHRFVPAEQASYVVGVERPAIMGKPVLAYDSEAAARAAMQRYGGEPKSWAELQPLLIGP